MNKLLLLISSLFIFNINTNAQVCIPDETISDLIVPSSSDDLVQAQVGVAYEQTFYFKVPSDTIISGYSASVNYLAITNIDNLPDGFTYSCSTPDCSFDGDSYGCLVITGTPDESFSNDSIRITVNGNINGTGVIPIIGIFSGDVPVTRDFAIYVAPADASNSSNEVVENSFINIFPNPSSDIVNININANQSGDIQIKVINILGQTIFNVTNPSSNGLYKQQITKDILGSGIFFVSVKINGQEQVQKLIIK
jgi:hypothetical protein